MMLTLMTDVMNATQTNDVQQENSMLPMIAVGAAAVFGLAYYAINRNRATQPPAVAAQPISLSEFIGNSSAGKNLFEKSKKSHEKEQTEKRTDEAQIETARKAGVNFGKDALARMKTKGIVNKIGGDNAEILKGIATVAVTRRKVKPS